MKPLESEPFNRLLVGSREAYGFGNISTKDPDATEKINGVLERGESLCILPDQNARKRGVMVRFLGKPASTLRAPRRPT